MFEVCIANYSFNDPNDDPVECQYRGSSVESLPVKFWLVLVFGSSLCLLGIPENLYLLYLFLSRKSFRNSPLFYMAILALFDLLMSPLFILANSVAVWFECKADLGLYLWYLWYIKPVVSAARTIMVASNYLILIATLERFLKTKQNNIFVAISSWVSGHRGLLSFGTVIAGYLIDGTTFFTIVIKRQLNCTNWNEFKLEGSALFGRLDLHYAYFFYFNAIIKTLSPFFLLLFMNFAIIKAVKKDQQSELRDEHNLDGLSAPKIPQPPGDTMTSARKLRDATRLLLFVVFMYLISNVLNVILRVWEFFETSIEGAYSIPHDFQDYGTDASNIIVVLCRNLRLPGYLLCNASIRAESKLLLKNIGFLKREKAANDNQANYEMLILTENKDNKNGFDRPLESQEAQHGKLGGNEILENHGLLYFNRAHTQL